MGITGIRGDCAYIALNHKAPYHVYHARYKDPYSTITRIILRPPTQTNEGHSTVRARGSQKRRPNETNARPGLKSDRKDPHR